MVDKTSISDRVYGIVRAYFISIVNMRRTEKNKQEKSVRLKTKH